MILHTMKSNIERSKTAALVYGSLGAKKAAQDALEMYEKDLFPFLDPEKSPQDVRVRLVQEMSRGPISVKSMATPKRKFRSSLLRKTAS